MIGSQFSRFRSTMIHRTYYEDGIHWACEPGWRRFLADVVVRSTYLCRDLCREVRRHGMDAVPADRKAWETIRRQVAAYCWVFRGAGGLFTLDAACEVLGIAPDRIQSRILAMCDPPPDINRVIRVVSRQRFRCYAESDCPGKGGQGMGARIDAAVQRPGLHDQ